MKVLAIESSGNVASVAIASEEKVLAEITTDSKKTHSQTLLPMIDEILRKSECTVADMDFIAISKGPGSFTGLRIGSATAKGMAFAAEKEIVEVGTLEAMAYGVSDTTSVICPLIDARNKNVFAGFYRVNEDGDLIEVEVQQALTIDETIEKINGFEKVVLLGDGVDANKEELKEKITTAYRFVPVHLNRQRAGIVAALGMRYYEMGKAMPSSEHAPTYLRKSQAERMREQ